MWQPPLMHTEPAAQPIAGGGGLITVPALWAAGLPPHLVLGTNKGQSVFGTFAATIAFGRAGALDRKQARVTFPLAFVSALAGSKVVMVLAPATLRPVVLVLLVAAAIVITFRPRRLEAGSVTLDDDKRAIRAAAIAIVLGAYDGFFGPGTGTFLILAFALLLGENLTRASGDAKVANLASNLAALSIFTYSGVVLWRVAIPMAVANLVGGALGARIAVRGGDRVVRGVVLAVVLGLVAKLTFDLLNARAH
jgi:uncharacterized membrane protein YfcA